MILNIQNAHFQNAVEILTTELLSQKWVLHLGNKFSSYSTDGEMRTERFPEEQVSLNEAHQCSLLSQSVSHSRTKKRKKEKKKSAEQVLSLSLSPSKEDDSAV